MSATITIALYGDSHGFIIAVIPRQDPYHMGTSLVVGDVRKISADGEPDLWRAWLWPLAGGNLPVTQSCKASDAASTDTLRARLQKRADSKAWWTVPDGRCLAALEHGGRESRCETAAAVEHDVHRHYADGVEWMAEEDYERSLGEPDGIDEAVARITDEDVEDSLRETLRRAGYAGSETREAL